MSTGTVVDSISRAANRPNLAIWMVVNDITVTVIVVVPPGTDVVQPAVIVAVACVGWADMVEVVVASCRPMKDEQNEEALRAIRTASHAPTLSRCSMGAGAGEAPKKLAKTPNKNRCFSILAYLRAQDSEARR